MHSPTAADLRPGASPPSPSSPPSVTAPSSPPAQPVPEFPSGTLARVRVYLAERFPVPVTLLLSLATAAGAVASSQAAAVRSGQPVVFDAALWGGVALVFLYLFHLRVFDEHKDFAVDAKTRPDRPVQRGIVSLAELRAVGAIAVGLELAIAFGAGPRAGLWYLVPFAYSLLMYVEFFAPRWLGARIHWYALSHTLCMPLLAVAVAMRLGAETAAWTPELLAFAGLNLTAYLGVDVLRKTWAPDSEVDGLDSWSRRLGLARAARLGIGILAASATLAAFIGWRLGGGPVWLGVVLAATVWGASVVRRFAAAPTAEAEGGLVLVAGLHILILFVGLAVVAALSTGAVFAAGFAGV